MTAEAELDALAEEDAEVAAPAGQQSPSPDDTAQPSASKSKKKKKAKAAADTEDIEALLVEPDGPAEQKPDPPSSFAQPEAASPAAAEPAAEAGKGKKKKKKGKGGAKEEEDLDAVLAELGMAPAAKPEAERTTDAQPPITEAAPAAAAATEAGGEDEEDAAAEGEGKVCNWPERSMSVQSVTSFLALSQAYRLESSLL